MGASRDDFTKYPRTPHLFGSRGTDDDELARRVCALAGFTPRIAHRLDSLHFINTLVGAGLGVAMLAESGIERGRDDVSFRRLDAVAGVRRSFLVARRGQWSWPPIAALARSMTVASRVAREATEKSCEPA